MYITRFFRPGADQKVSAFDNLQNPSSDLKSIIKEQSSSKAFPSFWSFSSFEQYPTKQSFIEASAVLLEYDAKADRHAIDEAVKGTGLECYSFTTKYGVAYVFPLDEPVIAGRYTRYVAVLAELIGQQGLLKGSIQATYLISPDDNTKVVAFAGDPIPTNFHFLTTDLKEPVDTWVGHGTPKAQPSYSKGWQPASVEAQQAISASFNFDEMFVKLDSKLNQVDHQIDQLGASIQALGEQAASILKKMESK